jgi:Uma2 family endonuclease
VSTQPKPRLTPEEYLAIERMAEFRSEYYNGEMFATSGASMAHGRLSVRLVAALFPQIRGRRCQLYSNDMRIRVAQTGLYTYPDLVGVCGEEIYASDEFDVLLNPNLIVEVLSPSTEAYDRGRKFEHYRMIESLSQYLLVAQDRVHLDLYTNAGDGWKLQSYDSLTDQVALQSIGCMLAVSHVYDGVDLGGA